MSDIFWTVPVTERLMKYKRYELKMWLEFREFFISTLLYNRIYNYKLIDLLINHIILNFFYKRFYRILINFVVVKWTEIIKNNIKNFLIRHFYD